MLPRKLQEVPGILQGGVGWQGIVPARAAKMGSIAVDKAIAKLGTPAEFYQQLEPEKIAEHIVKMFRARAPAAGRRGHAARAPAALARPAAAGEAGRRSSASRPSCRPSSATITDEIGVHIDQLLDPKIMVIDHFRKNPELVVRIFRDFGQRELNLMVPFGFVFGFLLGIPVAVVDQPGPPVVAAAGARRRRRLDHQRARHVADLRAAGAEADPRHQGARPVPAPPGRGGRGLRRDHRRRRDHARADRRLPARRAARRPHPADARHRAAPGDRQGGRAGCAARSGSRSAPDASTRSASRSPSRRSAARSRRSRTRSSASGRRRRSAAWSPRRTKELPPTDFVEMMRSAIKEDEWMLYAHGAIMGAAGGVPPPVDLRSAGWMSRMLRTDESTATDDDASPAACRRAARPRPGRPRAAALHTTGWSVRTSARLAAGRPRRDQPRRGRRAGRASRRARWP